MISRLLYRSITLVALGGGLAVAHSLVPLKYPIILGTPKAPEPDPVPTPPASANVPTTQGTSSAEATAPIASVDAMGLDISLDQAFTLFAQGTPFIDARHVEEYASGHVENAFYLTADLLVEGKGQAVLSMLDPRSPLVVYCGGGLCDASKNLVNYLQAAGFTKCHIMHDGYPAWVGAGHPTASGEPEIGG